MINITHKAIDNHPAMDSRLRENDVVVCVSVKQRTLLLPENPLSTIGRRKTTDVLKVHGVYASAARIDQRETRTVRLT